MLARSSAVRLRMSERNVDAELLVKEAASDLAEVVALDVEEQTVDELAARLPRWRPRPVAAACRCRAALLACSWSGPLEGGFGQRQDVQHVEGLQLHGLRSSSPSRARSRSPLSMMITCRPSLTSASTRLPCKVVRRRILQRHCLAESLDDVLVGAERGLHQRLSALDSSAELPASPPSDDHAGLQQDFARVWRRPSARRCACRRPYRPGICDRPRPFSKP